MKDTEISETHVPQKLLFDVQSYWQPAGTYGSKGIRRFFTCKVEDLDCLHSCCRGGYSTVDVIKLPPLILSHLIEVDIAQWTSCCKPWSNVDKLLLFYWFFCVGYVTFFLLHTLRMILEGEEIYVFCSNPRCNTFFFSY
jgi:hypothetical protein